VIRRMTVVTAETLETDPDNFFAELWADASPFYMYVRIYLDTYIIHDACQILIASSGLS
jgi:hypothetical protein